MPGPGTSPRSFGREVRLAGPEAPPEHHPDTRGQTNMYSAAPSGTKHEQPRAHRPRPQPDLAEQPGAQVLVGDDVARPAAEEASEISVSTIATANMDESGIHVAELERAHRFRRLDRRLRSCR
jgi:hypothetical protein